MSWLVGANDAPAVPALTEQSCASSSPNLKRQSVAVPGGRNQMPLSTPQPEVATPAKRLSPPNRPTSISHDAGEGVSESSLVSVVELQPGSGSVVPAASRESIMPSPSSSLPLLHFGAGGGSVAQLPTVSCSSATSPLARKNAIVASFVQSTGPFSVERDVDHVASAGLQRGGRHGVEDRAHVVVVGRAARDAGSDLDLGAW